MADEIECPECNGEGEVEHPHLHRYASIVAESPPDPVMVECEDCGGRGWRAPTDDELADMAERQAEDAASGEPPVTMQEQYIDAWHLKQALRR
jgi:hypothetical protein